MRRLPVIQDVPSEDRLAAMRPRWHWAFIGAGLTVTLWLPLAMLLMPFGATPLLVLYVAASGGAGALVGRFGTRAPATDAALAPVVGAAFLGGLAALPREATLVVALLSFVVLAALGAPAAFFAARFTASRRPP